MCRLVNETLPEILQRFPQGGAAGKRGGRARPSGRPQFAYPALLLHDTPECRGRQPLVRELLPYRNGDVGSPGGRTPFTPRGSAPRGGPETDRAAAAPPAGAKRTLLLPRQTNVTFTAA
jgi:hypothetical protein